MLRERHPGYDFRLGKTGSSGSRTAGRPQPLLREAAATAYCQILKRRHRHV